MKPIFFLRGALVAATLCGGGCMKQTLSRPNANNPPKAKTDGDTNHTPTVSEWIGQPRVGFDSKN